MEISLKIYHHYHFFLCRLTWDFLIYYNFHQSIILCLAIRAHLRHTTKKVAPSEEVERRFKAHPIYQAEREFYDFAAKEFDAVWRRVTDRGEAKANGKESDDGGGNDDTGMKTKFLLDQFHFEKIRP